VVILRPVAARSLLSSAASGSLPQREGRRSIAAVSPVDPRYGAGLIVLVAVYYGAAHLGYALEFAGPVAAILWLPVGVGVAFLYLGGLRFWPGVVLGDLLVNNYSALPAGAAIGQTVGNLLEVLVATVLMRRLLRNRWPLDSVGGLTMMLVAIAAGTGVSATIGSLSLWLGQVISAGALPKVWRTWWLGDASGALIVVPLALAWVSPTPLRWNRQRVAEAGLLVATLCGVSELAVRVGRPLTYVVFPTLIWAALRFGQRGATLAVAIATSFAVWGTTHQQGPFVFHSTSGSVLSTQLYIAVAALSTLCVAAVVSEREEVAARLAASRVRLVDAIDSERRRIERDLHDGAQGRLAAVHVRLGVAAERVRERPDEATQALLGAQDEVAQAIEDLRDLAHGIQPRMLAQFGLPRAIESFVERWSIPVDMGTLPATRFDPSVETTAYFVLAEALTNAHKHARASSIRVRARAHARSLWIEVLDDGVGGVVETGFGVQGLRDRVEATGGTLEIDSPPGGGTRIIAEIPGSALVPQPPP
jgi:signal transduction histidine kinase